jgi:hypothetical protein
VPTPRELECALAYFRKKHEDTMQRDGARLRKELAEAQRRLKTPDLSDEQRKTVDMQIMMIEHRLQPPDRRFAEFILDHWKLQKHSYEKFGGGRVLFQQAGIEAFDAMHEWLRQQEKKGAFRIDDESLRKQFYAYWTTMNHGAFLSDDKEQIRKFLNPPWALLAETPPASQPRSGGSRTP